MNDQDLERDLRTQRGPREEGYLPGRLPMSLDDSAAAGRRPSRLPRAAMLVAAGAAGALAVAIAAGVFSGPGPGVGANGSTSPSAEASTPASGSGSCTQQDVSMTGEPWGGAAGSRGTVVTFALASGRDACQLGKGLAAEIADANGSVLVTTGAPQSGGAVALVPGASFTIGISWSNWCAAAPAAPVSLALKMSGWDAFATVTVASGGLDPVPPCMGSAEPTALSWSGLEPQE
jgi:hypothetical protein